MLFDKLLRSKKDALKVFRKAKKAFDVVNDVADKLPSKEDSKLQVVVKTMAIVGTVASSMVPSVKNELKDRVDQLGLVPKNSDAFLSVFFDTSLHEEFELDRYTLDSSTITEAVHPKFGTLLIQQYTWGRISTFYHSKDFDFSEALQMVWDLYGGHIHFDVTLTGASFSSFTVIDNPLFGGDQDRLEKYVARHLRYKLDGRSKTYMLYGLPGTGKTSFALAFANRIGNRVLRIGTTSFSSSTLAEVIFILESLKPDFLLIDDVDKAHNEQHLPGILSAMQEIKQRRTTSVLLTANVVRKFDNGLKRPGRVDTWLEFKAPETHVRKAILESYLKESQSEHLITSEQLEVMVVYTKGMTQDYLREIVDRLKYDPIPEILEDLLQMRSLLNLKDPNAIEEESESSEEDSRSRNITEGGITLRLS